MVIGCDGRGRQLIGPEHVIARSGTNFPCQCELSLVFRSVTTSTMDSSPASLFNSYEQDFQQILQSIHDKLEGDGTDQRGGRLWTLLATQLDLTLSSFQSRRKLHYGE